MYMFPALWVVDVGPYSVNIKGTSTKRHQNLSSYITSKLYTIQLNTVWYVVLKL